MWAPASSITRPTSCSTEAPALSFTQVGADTLLSVTGTAVGHFTNVSAASLNNQANFAGLLA